MRPWVRRAVRAAARAASRAALLTASLAAVSAGVSGFALCMASPLHGNETASSALAPVSACGSAAAVLGDSMAGCEGIGAGYPGVSSRSASPGRSVGQPPGRPAASASGGSGLSAQASLPDLSRLSAISAMPGRGSAARLAARAIPGLRGLAPIVARPAPGDSRIGGAAAIRPYSGSLLHADTSGGMGARSLLCLTTGALMAGAAALMVAGRRTYDVRR
jgi:hypothetical protein